MQNFVFAVCFLASFLSAFSGISLGDIALPTFSEETQFSLYNETAFCQAVGEMLQKENIEYEKIEVTATENQDLSINIDSVTVTGCAKVEKCQNLIRENTGLYEVYVYE